MLQKKANPKKGIIGKNDGNKEGAKRTPRRKSRPGDEIDILDIGEFVYFQVISGNFRYFRGISGISGDFQGTAGKLKKKLPKKCFGKFQGISGKFENPH